MRPACLHRLFAPARAFGAIFVAIGLGVGLGGCASEQDSIDKQLAKLHDDVTRLQAETDRMGERMEALELRTVASERTEERVAAATPQTVTRPKLKVVRVEPEAEPSAAEASDAAAEGDSGPRVVIQGEGKTLESRTLPGSQKSAPKAAPAPTPSKPPAASK